MKLKSFLFIIGLALIVIPGLAQKTNLIFFTDAGEKFTLSINGVRQNGTPESNVKVQGLEAEAVQALIVFDTPIPQMKQLVALEPGHEMTFAIKKNNKGKYVMRAVSVIDIPTSSAEEKPVVVSKEPAPVASTTTTVTPAPKRAPQSETTVSTTSIATDGASVKINVGGTESTNSASVNIQVTGVNTNLQTESISTTTTTSTTTQSSPAPARNDAPKKSEPVAKKTACSAAMSGADFERAKKSIEAKSFAEEQMTVCKQVINANCLSVTQVVGLLELFSFEENKLSVAKMAYAKTVDKNNYYQVNDALTYAASVEELNNFIEQQ